MKGLILHISLVLSCFVANAQSITKELYKLNSKYAEFKSYYSQTKVSYLDSSNNVEEVQYGKYVQYGLNSLYILGPYEILTFDKELLQINHNDSTAVFLLSTSASTTNKQESLSDYLKKVTNYLKISSDTSLTRENEKITINVQLKYPVDYVVGLKVTYSKDYSLQEMEIKLSNKETIRFEYFNISFDKKKISKMFSRSKYLLGSGADLKLQQKYSAYKFKNFSDQQ